VVAWYAEGFSDRIGDRLLLFDNTGPALELLRLSPQLAAVPNLEAALRARVDQLKRFDHPVFARVRCVTTLDDPRPRLAIVSELVHGQRLSEVLQIAQDGRFKPNPGAAVWLLRQLLPAIGALHESGSGIAHGLLDANRVVVTPDGRLAITEYVLAEGVQGLGLSSAELWRHFGIAALDTGSGPVLDPRSDVAQLGVLALSVLLGRQLRSDEYPDALSALLDEACSAQHWMLAPMLRPWLQRALGLGTAPFGSASEAQTDLDRLLPGVKGAWSQRLLPRSDQAARLPPASSGISTTSPARWSPQPVSPLRQGPTGSTQAHGSSGRKTPTPREQPLIARLHRQVAMLGAVALLEAVALALVVTGVVPANLPTFARGGAPTVDLDEALEGTAHAASAIGLGANAPEPAGRGWVAIRTESPMRVFVDGVFVGTSGRSPFAVPSGDRVIGLVNPSSGFRTTQTVRVKAGRIVSITPAQVRDAPAERR